MNKAIFAQTILKCIPEGTAERYAKPFAQDEFSAFKSDDKLEDCEAPNAGTKNRREWLFSAGFIAECGVYPQAKFKELDDKCGMPRGHTQPLADQKIPQLQLHFGNAEKAFLSVRLSCARPGHGLSAGARK